MPARLRRGELPDGEPLVLFDEIHKYARWRNLLKGIYDTEKSRRRILVTGSARLDYYRKGGDRPRAQVVVAASAIGDGARLGARSLGCRES